MLNAIKNVMQLSKLHHVNSDKVVVIIYLEHLSGGIQSGDTVESNY